MNAKKVGANAMAQYIQSACNQAHLNKNENKSEVVKKGLTLSTADIFTHDRREWLQDMICQEYTRVKVRPPTDGNLFNQTTLYGWESLRLSVIQSRGLTIEKLAGEPYYNSQDNYLAVILLAGNYLLEQNGREVFLQAGDITIYDATRPHRIQSSAGFSKLLVTIPRKLMRDRIAGVEHCTALHVSGKKGMGAIATTFIQSVASQLDHMSANEFSALSEQSLDLLTLAFSAVRPHSFNLARSRSFSLRLVKDFIERYLGDSELDTTMIATGTGLSPRHINDLFNDEQTSLMRYVWARRLEKCRQDIATLNPIFVSIIAYKWGFNNLSHFSRAFKQQFGVCPTALKRDNLQLFN